MKQYFVIGPVTVDLVSQVKELPKGDEDFHPEEPTTRMNGFSWILSNHFSMFGTPFQAYPVAGTGLYGEMVQNALNDKGIIFFEYENMNGCMYTLVDPQGNRNPFVVPGAEYIMPTEILSQIPLDEIDTIVLSGDDYLMEMDEAFFEFLDSFSGRIIYYPGPQGILSPTMEEIYSRHVHLCVSEEEARILTGEQEGIVLTEALFEKTSAPILLYRNDGKAFYYDGQQEIHTTFDYSRAQDYSGMMESFLSGYLIAEQAGLPIESCMTFGLELSQQVGMTMDVILDSTQEETLKKRLAQLILDS